MSQFHFPDVFIGNTERAHTHTHTHTKGGGGGDKLIVFEIAKTNNEMMSSVLSNILGQPWGNSSKQVRLIYMHTSKNNSVTLAQPTPARCGL